MTLATEAPIDVLLETLSVPTVASRDGELLAPEPRPIMLSPRRWARRGSGT